METSFWLNVWKERRIGFHAPEVNFHLRENFDRLGIGSGDRIFLPLCGKSHDMTWLAEKGIEVVGVEVSPIAVREYWEERQLEPTVSDLADGLGQWWSGGGVSILLADFFSLRSEDLPSFDAFYDRAALVAMPPDMRARYVEQLDRFTREASRGLLVAMERDEGEGPPFSVTREEVQNLFNTDFTLSMIGSRRSRIGVTSAWILERRSIEFNGSGEHP